MHEVYYPEDGEFHWHDLAQNNPDGNRWRPRGWRPVEPGNVWAASGAAAGGAAGSGGGAATASKEPAARGPRPTCLLYTSPSPRDLSTSRMPSSA